MLNLVLCNHSEYSAEEHRENLQELKVTDYYLLIKGLLEAAHSCND